MKDDRNIYRQMLKEYSINDNENRFNKVEEKEEIEEDYYKSESIQERRIRDFIILNKKYILLSILILILICLVISVLLIYKNNNKWNKLLDYLNENTNTKYTNTNMNNNYTVSMKSNGDNIIVTYKNDIIIDSNAYYSISLSTLISKDSSLIDINCKSNTKLYFANQYEEGNIKLDISNYIKNTNNNIDVTFSNYKISGRKIDGSSVDPNTTGGILNIKKDEFIYQMVYGINEIIKKINDNGFKIEIKDIGFINYES